MRTSFFTILLTDEHKIYVKIFNICIDMHFSCILKNHILQPKENFHEKNYYFTLLSIIPSIKYLRKESSFWDSTIPSRLWATEMKTEKS